MNGYVFGDFTYYTLYKMTRPKIKRILLISVIGAILAGMGRQCQPDNISRGAHTG